MSRSTPRARRALASLVAVGALVVGAGGASVAMTHGHPHATHPAAAPAAHRAPAPARVRAPHAATRAGDRAARTRATGVRPTSSRPAAAAVRGLLAGSYRPAPLRLSATFRPSLHSRTLPRVRGTLLVGHHLTATRGTWSPSNGVHYRYHWVVGGRAVPGATSSTFLLGRRAAGKTVVVQVTATKKDYTSTTASSRSTHAVQLPAVDGVRAPRVSGRPVVGRTLSATPGTWSVRHVALSYQWVDATSGRAIRGATSSSFRPTARLVGHRLAVVVTASSPGFRPARVTTAVRGVVSR